MTAARGPGADRPSVAAGAGSTSGEATSPTSGSSNLQTRADGDTRARIVEVAMRLFAEHGFDSVSVRQITTEAQANLGAINYHFGSKDELIHEVFRSLATPVNHMRLAALDEYEGRVGDARYDVEEVARALIAPAIRYAADATGGGFFLTRLLVLARAMRRPFITAVLAEQYDRVFHRFVSAFSRAMPRLPYEEVCWRYDFMIGSLLYAVGYFDGSSRIKRVTEGRCDTDDVESIIDHLVAFAASGMRAPSLRAVEGDMGTPAS